ncbi:AraC-type DNA-binding domain-containing protein [Serpentinimonas raichei]|uniref:AraC-type DNA-binding domain-containing protein n=1 Tax=Serpentinimonas raichei TaxID=1458425 RepID=A0A060NG18_9BURK|nr:AraC family transcriptional regulator [Serpentinimonas raichei]BAO80556.1 AraC-type DNA-binding domain-containing protein [Serpentinimonas raichei]
MAPYARTLWDTACAEGMTQAALEQALGQEAPGEADVPVSAYLSLLQQALAHAGPGFAWRLGQSVKPTTYGVNGILLLACHTLGEALDQVLRFESLVHDLGRSTLTWQGDTVEYVWCNGWGSHPAADALVESVFSGIHACAQWLVGKPIAGVALEFSHRQDDATAQAISQASGARVRWGGALHRANFPAALLSLQIPQANKTLLPLLQRHADELLQARHPREGGIVAQVRQSISGRLGRGAVKLADVADDLHLSTRTLQRRLAETGMTYQALIDATRHELACHYLATSAMPIAEVGYLLGYHESAAFHHAFKQWQGQGPGQYRAGCAELRTAHYPARPNGWSAS